VEEEEDGEDEDDEKGTWPGEESDRLMSFSNSQNMQKSEEERHADE
jgi:hypothetical protein